MKKSLCIEYLFSDREFYDRIRLVREAGFDYLEFGDWTELDLGRVRALCSEYMVRVASMHGDGGPSLTSPGEREAFLEYLSQSIAVARYLSCQNLVVHADTPGGPGDGASAFTKIAAATRALLDASRLAEKAGITLVLRPVSALRYPLSSIPNVPSAGDVVRVVNSPGLRLLYDLGQMLAAEGDVRSSVRKYGDLIGYVHVGDAAFGEDAGKLVRFGKILAEELDYRGFVGFRFREAADVAARLEIIREL